MGSDAEEGAGSGSGGQLEAEEELRWQVEHRTRQVVIPGHSLGRCRSTAMGKLEIRA